MKRCICHFTKWQIHPSISKRGEVLVTCCAPLYAATCVLMPLCSGRAAVCVPPFNRTPLCLELGFVASERTIRTRTCNHGNSEISITYINR